MSDRWALIGLKWHHFACRKRGGIVHKAYLIIYIDGVAQWRIEPMDIQGIEAAALAELQEEALRFAIAQAKTRIIVHRAKPWWQKLFPYRLKLEKI